MNQNYKIEILLAPQRIGNCLMYFWSIYEYNQNNWCNISCDWSSSITSAFNNACNEYRRITDSHHIPG